jgi:hypothetical protein
MDRHDSTNNRTQVTLKSLSSLIIPPLRDGYCEALNGFCNRWRCLGIWVLTGGWFTVLLYTASAIIRISSGSVSYLEDKACVPDGSFSIEPKDYRYWSRSGFFQITLAFGNMDFTQVKAIDIAWDIVGISG